MVSRVERSALANWWWTVDRWLIGALGALIVLGLVLTLAASPPVAERLGMSPFISSIGRSLFSFPPSSCCLRPPFCRRGMCGARP